MAYVPPGITALSFMANRPVILPYPFIGGATTPFGSYYLKDPPEKHLDSTEFLSDEDAL